LSDPEVYALDASGMIFLLLWNCIKAFISIN